ncbi:hypothetical protein JYU09_01315 [bacterium AH-315-O15]|nr:hypothetical protein [bacterium AH-315-O15]
MLCPDGMGQYRVGKVSGSYYYTPGEILCHRRPVTWLNVTIDRAAMSEALLNSTASMGTTSNITKYSDEIETLLGGVSAPTLISTDASVEDPSSFALEAHLALVIPRRLMRDLGSVVLVLPSTMHNGRHHDAVRCPGAEELVRDQAPWFPALALQQLPKNRAAARRSRWDWTRISITSPSWSTARQRY